jgi:hypothetical protein
MKFDISDFSLFATGAGEIKRGRRGYAASHLIGLLLVAIICSDQGTTCDVTLVLIPFVRDGKAPR